MILAAGEGKRFGGPKALAKYPQRNIFGDDRQKFMGEQPIRSP